MTEGSQSAVEARSEEEVRADVRAVILELAPEAGNEPPSEARLVEDLGFHSLALLELAFSLEDEFDLEPIDEKTAQSITTIGAVSEHVIGELRGRGEIAGGES
ncbi:acyl carrier protein [Salinactinospora qingdaonensis]|uniref:Carrier domain-containing protein n=1 Tax=Salinactinospora qingdaonensis TaxID=702744 RepID=A0ABP7FA92_9ACTN